MLAQVELMTSHCFGLKLPNKAAASNRNRRSSYTRSVKMRICVNGWKLVRLLLAATRTYFTRVNSVFTPWVLTSLNKCTVGNMNWGQTTAEKYQEYWRTHLWQFDSLIFVQQRREKKMANLLLNSGVFPLKSNKHVFFKSTFKVKAYFPIYESDFLMLRFTLW